MKNLLYKCPNMSVIIISEYNQTYQHICLVIIVEILLYSIYMIYITTCTQCKKQYIGMTKRRLVDRIKEHSSDIRITKDKVSGTHYNLPGHSIDNFKVQVLEKVVPNNTQMLLSRESYWINRFQTKTPHGLNTMS